MSHGSSIVSQVVCVLCADKLDQPTSRINVCGRSAFPVETEIRKLPISIYISEETRICVPCLRKLKKRKSLEENLEATTKDLVGTYNSSSTSFNSVLPNSCRLTLARRLNRKQLPLVLLCKLQQVKQQQCQRNPNRSNLVSRLVGLLFALVYHLKYFVKEKT